MNTLGGVDEYELKSFVEPESFYFDINDSEQYSLMSTISSFPYNDNESLKDFAEDTSPVKMKIPTCAPDRDSDIEEDVKPSIPLLKISVNRKNGIPSFSIKKKAENSDSEDEEIDVVTVENEFQSGVQQSNMNYKMNRPNFSDMKFHWPGIPDVKIERPNIPVVKSNLPDVKINRPYVPDVKTNRPNIPSAKINRPTIPDVKINRPMVPDVKPNRPIVTGPKINRPSVPEVKINQPKVSDVKIIPNVQTSLCKKENNCQNLNKVKPTILEATDLDSLLEQFEAVESSVSNDNGTKSMISEKFKPKCKPPTPRTAILIDSHEARPRVKRPYIKRNERYTSYVTTTPQTKTFTPEKVNTVPIDRSKDYLASDHDYCAQGFAGNNVPNKCPVTPSIQITQDIDISSHLSSKNENVAIFENVDNQLELFLQEDMNTVWVTSPSSYSTDSQSSVEPSQTRTSGYPPLKVRCLSSSSYSPDPHSNSCSPSSNFDKDGFGSNSSSPERSDCEKQSKTSASPILTESQKVERKIVFIGNILSSTKKSDLYDRFSVFGPVEDVQLHFRRSAENYAFVTFQSSKDAYNAIEHGNDDPKYPKYKLSFGGRRRFCGNRYSDLDYINDGSANGMDGALNDFDRLLQAAKRKLHA